MSETFDFKAIRYNRPYKNVSSKGLGELVGFDTETLINGKPFLFCTSYGDSFLFADIPHVLFNSRYQSTNFVVWNLRFDSGSIIYHLPNRQKDELRCFQRTTYNGIVYRYYPHKFLRLSKSKHSVTFWDINNFYHMRLEHAAKKYLGKSKSDIETKEFTTEYVDKNFQKIKDYCIQDCVLTRDLASYFLKYLRKFDINPASLYSRASISYRYFKQKTDIVDVWRFWRSTPKLLEFACNSYTGGKFEITARGRFEGYEYDIDYAYGNEIANLVDISKAVITRFPRYSPSAIYGFLKVQFLIKSPLHHTIAVKFNGGNTFPLGLHNTYVTKAEYEFLIKHNVLVKIEDAFWVNVKDIEYPYRKIINRLWDIKSDKKEVDKMIRTTAKYMGLSFYGKMCQLIKTPEGTLRAGPAWNPIYASVITSNVRLRMAEIQNLFWKENIAVHTDAVMTLKPLPKRFLRKGMGGLQLKAQGEGVTVACGMYQIGKKFATRSFHPSEDFNWFKTLKNLKRESVLKFTERRPLSWMDAIFRKIPQHINEFRDVPKKIDVNCDSKRIWFSHATGKSLLDKLDYSSHRIKGT